MGPGVLEALAAPSLALPLAEGEVAIALGTAMPAAAAAAEGSTGDMPQKLPARSGRLGRQ